jgi:hypothetical protein
MRIAFWALAIGAAGVCVVGCGGGSGAADGGTGNSTGNHSDGAAGAGGGAAGTGVSAGGTSGSAGASGGGATGSGTCGNVEPCGGAVTGTWKFTADCINLTALQPTAETICATASIGAASATISGNVTFNSDQTYELQETETALISWTIPSTCTSGTTCAAFGAGVAAQLDTGETFVCTGTTTCGCTETAASVTTDNGTYSAGGTSLSLISALTGNGESGGYCVQGSTLHIITVDTTMNMGPMGQATIDEDITATKQ